MTNYTGATGKKYIENNSESRLCILYLIIFKLYINIC